jgi:hypothetical protein
MKLISGRLARISSRKNVNARLVTIVASSAERLKLRNDVADA